MDVIEAIRRIKERHPDTVIVGLSVHHDEVLARALVEAGGDTYISKSAPGKDLVAAIRSACFPREAPEP